MLAVGANPGIQYEYVIPIDPTKVHYTWQTQATACSEKCGGGFEELSAQCVASNGKPATENQCVASDKPLTGRFKCNVDACPAR